MGAASSGRRPLDMSGTDEMWYAEAGDLPAVRAYAAARAVTLGLPAARVDVLTLAVSELATNTLQHTAGGGRIRLWVDGGQLVCEVVDSGSLPPSTGGMPPPDAVRGRGLAIVKGLCDGVEIAPLPVGTRIEVRLNL